MKFSEKKKAVVGALVLHKHSSFCFVIYFDCNTLTIFGMTKNAHLLPPK